MPLWAQTLLTLAALALMLALVAAVWALRRVAQRAAGVLTIVEEELRPLVGKAHALTRSEEHTSELQSRLHLVCRLLLEKKKKPGKRPRLAAALSRPNSPLRTERTTA